MQGIVRCGNGPQRGKAALYLEEKQARRLLGRLLLFDHVDDLDAAIFRGKGIGAVLHATVGPAGRRKILLITETNFSRSSGCSATR